jgi:hypothetical protein
MYKTSFDFSPGSLGVYLDTFDERTHDFIQEELRMAAERGEEQMKLTHPWKNRTGDAERELWAEAPRVPLGSNYSLHMGHGVEYGIYLEKYYEGRFQVIMPTLVETARAFMEALTGMLEHLDTPVVPVVGPGVGFDRGTSQGTTEHIGAAEGATKHAAKKARFYFRGQPRNAGQFASYKGVELGSGVHAPRKPRKSRAGTGKTGRTNRTKRG